MTKAWQYILGIGFLVTVGCIKDEPPVIGNPIITGTKDGVYMTNEGNFQFGNASVSYYEEGLSEAVQDLFEPANGRALGDVCQSMYFFKGKAYVVVNNSGKVEVVDEDTFVSEGVITGLQSPRFFLPINNAKAYVTDLYADAIHIVDLNTLSKTGEIPTSGWTEQLILAFGKAFVTNRESNYLMVVNTAFDSLVDSLKVGYGASSIVEDQNGKLWVACSGRDSQNENASLHRIDAASLSVEQSFIFNDPDAAIGDLSFNGAGDSLYFLNQGVYQMAIIDVSLPSTPLISGDNKNYYGLGIDPSNGNIYLSDAIDFVQRGNIEVYSRNGTLKTSFLAGIIPGEFYFK